MFDDAGEGETVQDLIAHDFAEDGKEPPHEIDLDWLLKRRLYTMLLPTAGWFIDAEHSNTIAYLNRNRPPVLLAKGLQQVTVAVLRGEDRYVTSHLAESMAGPRLQDQTRPIGLLYGSKLGSDWDCWTVWLRDGVHDAISVDSGQPSCCSSMRLGHSTKRRTSLDIMSIIGVEPMRVAKHAPVPADYHAGSYLRCGLSGPAMRSKAQHRGRSPWSTPCMTFGDTSPIRSDRSVLLSVTSRLSPHGADWITSTARRFAGRLLQPGEHHYVTVT